MAYHPATRESKQILENMGVNMRKDTDQDEGCQSAVEYLKDECSNTVNPFNRCITIEDSNRSIWLVSSDPYILLSISNYYIQCTGYKVSIESKWNRKVDKDYQIVIRLANASTTGFGKRWVPIIIDYFRQKHSNYKLIGVTKDHGLEKLYFVPSANNFKNDEQRLPLWVSQLNFEKKEKKKKKNYH
eukprot:16079_1